MHDASLSVENIDSGHESLASEAHVRACSYREEKQKNIHFLSVSAPYFSSRVTDRYFCSSSSSLPLGSQTVASTVEFLVFHSLSNTSWLILVFSLQHNEIGPGINARSTRSTYYMLVCSSLVSSTPEPGSVSLKSP